MSTQRSREVSWKSTQTQPRHWQCRSLTKMHPCYPTTETISSTHVALMLSTSERSWSPSSFPCHPESGHEPRFLSPPNLHKLIYIYAFIFHDVTETLFKYFTMNASCYRLPELTVSASHQSWDTPAVSVAVLHRCWIKIRQSILDHPCPRATSPMSHQYKGYLSLVGVISYFAFLSLPLLYQSSLVGEHTKTRPLLLIFSALFWARTFLSFWACTSFPECVSCYV